jgi:hypothetical protein
MKIVINICLIWVVISSTAFAQMNEGQPKAVKLEEFGRANNGFIKAIFDSFYIDVINNSDAKGSVIIYGSEKESERRERFFKSYIRFRSFDASRLEIIKAGYRNEVLTQFWRVPKGAENPKLEPTAIKFDEFGIIKPIELKRRIKKLRAKLEKNDSKDLSQIYIVNYGNDKNVSVRENAVKKHLYEDCRDCFGLSGPRITFVRGSNNRTLRTTIWIIPPDAETPKF